MTIEPKDCWLVLHCMPHIHAFIRQPLAVYDNKQQAQARATSLGTFERFDGETVRVGWIEKLPRFVDMGENNAEMLSG